MKLNVLHQVNSLTIGGVETFVYRLCKYANEENTYVFSHKDGIVREWLETGLGIEVFLKDNKNIEDVIIEKDIDIVVMHTGSYCPDYAYTLAQKYPNVHFVTVMHTVCPGEPWVDKIIAISQAVYEFQADRTKTVLIYPGIDRYKDRSFIIGEVTRLAPYKYINDLLDIISEIVKIYPDVCLQIVGEEAADAPQYINYLKQEIARRNLENNIELLGYQHQIKYEDFDMFIHLVGDEAYPVTLLEALDRNIPTITYDKRGTREISAQYPQLILVNSKEEAIAIIQRYIGRTPKSMKETADDFSKVYKDVCAAN